MYRKHKLQINCIKQWTVVASWLSEQIICYLSTAEQETIPSDHLLCPKEEEKVTTTRNCLLKPSTFPDQKQKKPVLFAVGKEILSEKGIQSQASCLQNNCQVVHMFLDFPDAFLLKCIAFKSILPRSYAFAQKLHHDFKWQTKLTTLTK